MAYESIDKLQRAMAEEVFVHSKDSKKAAGRALGTILESLTYFVIRSWGLNQSIAIEQRLPEFGVPAITHNVEFSLHSRLGRIDIPVAYEPGKPLTTAKVKRLSSPLEQFLADWLVESKPLLSSDGVQTNCAVIHQSQEGIVTAQVEDVGGELVLHVNRLSPTPYAMFECKRVGVEEGQTKGPTTIEKAKQGAYVAASLSSIRKVANPHGSPLAVSYAHGKPVIGDYFETMKHLVTAGTLDEMEGMIVTVGVVSNHGNWFTRDSMNKEMKVLQGAYDWLLFLKDEALATFITDTILHPAPEYEPIKTAFLSTYTAGRKGGSRFTKKTMDRNAYIAMARYFSTNRSTIESSWFELLSEGRGSLSDLKVELQTLDERIHQLHAPNGSNL
jgi:hypothetical protein